jgi:tryptophanyl-tRNA synthetase
MIKACGHDDIYNSLMDDYQNESLKYVDLKQATADAVVATVLPFQERKKELLIDKKAMKDQIKASSEIIRKKAQKTLLEVKELTGLLNPKY